MAVAGVSILKKAMALIVVKFGHATISFPPA